MTGFACTAWDAWNPVVNIPEAQDETGAYLDQHKQPGSLQQESQECEVKPGLDNENLSENSF